MASFSVLSVSILVIILATLVFRQQRPSKLKQPPRLDETVPYVSNALQFLTNKKVFMTRLREALDASQIVQCRLGPMNIHFVTGGNNVSAIFRSSFTSEPWILSVLRHSGGYAPKDLAKFAADQSGSAHLPRSGTTAKDRSLPAPEERIWHAKTRLHDEALIGPRAVDAFSAAFQTFFGDQLTEASPVGKWVEDVRIFDFLRQNMSTAATRSALGSRIFELNPDLTEAFWDYEKYVESLAFGLPHWLSRRAVRARDRFRGMCLKWYEDADRQFEWDGGELNEAWEPLFGSQVSRGLARWVKSFDFSADSIGGIYALFLFGLNSNTVPICTWMMMEIIRDPELLQAIREEVSQAEVIDESEGRSLDYRKLVQLPLLQSVYVEALRLHVSILITRTSVEPVTIGGFNVPAGSVFQAPTHAAHLDETIYGISSATGYTQKWSQLRYSLFAQAFPHLVITFTGIYEYEDADQPINTGGTADHPANEFWAYRHVKESEISDALGHTTKRREFSMAGRGSSFFPYGGGISMCAGRNFAKREVLIAVAMIISRFDVEFVDWIKPDGTHSERSAWDNSGYANGVAAPPDRDMKIRWQRLW
ncbi:cytochrome P450 [Truncatella angustata]|uniref:Cytochrome P450 n=1 Tax=Truncatella angustata TaxID=152316 RepID=A0A9P8UVB5_9PEZI|nr:cytochrome P450 [Truncatella angustata]KAH6659053.1 cytochrome P450 [Truncatella angustata]